MIEHENETRDLHSKIWVWTPCISAHECVCDCKKIRATTFVLTWNLCFSSSVFVDVLNKPWIKTAQSKFTTGVITILLRTRPVHLQHCLSESEPKWLVLGSLGRGSCKEEFTLGKGWIIRDRWSAKQSIPGSIQHPKTSFWSLVFNCQVTEWVRDLEWNKATKFTSNGAYDQGVCEHQNVMVPS